MKDFKPAWWLRNKHLQTIVPSLCRRRVNLPLNRSIVETSDGDCLDLRETFLENPAGHVLILHGVGGCIRSSYVTPLMKRLLTHNHSSTLMHFRGASTQNRLKRTYHAGCTDDLQCVIDYLKQHHATLYVIGFSMGAAVLLNYLGRTHAPIKKAFAVSVPFDIEASAQTINKRFGKIYQHHMLSHIKKQLLTQSHLGLSSDYLKTLNTFWKLDDEITARFNGFKDAHDYYKKNSCRPILKNICNETHIIQAKDDPIIPEQSIPLARELSLHCHLHTFKHGGHVGFVSGRIPGRPRYYIDEFLIEAICR